MMYSITPHSITEVSPEEDSWRHIGTKIPHLREFSIEGKVSHRDSERKEKREPRLMHFEARFTKTIRRYCDSRSKTNCQRYTNSLPLGVVQC